MIHGNRVDDIVIAQMKKWHRPTCVNCGSELSPFGICPNVPPEEVRIMAAPVYCAPKVHPDGCACNRCELTRELCAEVAA